MVNQYFRHSGGGAARNLVHVYACCRKTLPAVMYCSRTRWRRQNNVPKSTKPGFDTETSRMWNGRFSAELTRSFDSVCKLIPVAIIIFHSELSFWQLTEKLPPSKCLEKSYKKFAVECLFFNILLQSTSYERKQWPLKTSLLLLSRT